jgi:hypothetical protein
LKPFFNVLTDFYLSNFDGIGLAHLLLQKVDFRFMKEQTSSKMETGI